MEKRWMRGEKAGSKFKKAGTNIHERKEWINRSVAYKYRTFSGKGKFLLGNQFFSIITGDLERVFTQK